MFDLREIRAELTQKVDYGQVDMCGIHIGGQANPMFRT